MSWLPAAKFVPLGETQPWRLHTQPYKFEKNISSNCWFSLTWSTAMFFNENKRKRLHNNRVKFPEDLVGAPTWPPFLCLGEPTWRSWRHVKTENISRKIHRTDMNLCETVWIFILFYQTLNFTCWMVLMMVWQWKPAIEPQKSKTCGNRSDTAVFSSVIEQSTAQHSTAGWLWFS